MKTAIRKDEPTAMDATYQIPLSVLINEHKFEEIYLPAPAKDISIYNPEVDRPALALSGFDGVEIYNSVSDIGQNSRPYSGYFVDILANMGVAYPIIAADDTHAYNGLDETKSYIMARTEDDSMEQILAAIRRGDFYASQGPELHVRREGDRIIADCTACVTINFLTNAAWVPDRMTRGQDLTHAEYPVKEWEKWVRVEVCDDQGRFAWSSVIRVGD